ncbi:MAG: T9SS type A sorting domain-containing protein [Candidatus Kapaibacterium sp.]|nr:T9SS type A sorting domain-containing protein [Bacteroidota bacterium]
MFYYLKNILLVLLCSLTVTAQNTTDVPVLQEWWRADNMGYGVKYSQFDNGGMTWLDNFYHGKGVLVISTPTGVKTWQLRYPGDTVNIFTWEGTNDWGKYKGPNPRIKTLKCNDDSITDYIDDYGNMYLGIQNGEPPKPKPIFCGITPDYITDFNNDNIDDILSWNTSLTKDSILAYVQYGANNVSEITVDSVRLPTELYTNSDRTVQPISMYKNLQGEIRLLLRYRIMDKQDGYRLYAFSKSSNGYTFELKDSRIISTSNNYLFAAYKGYNTISTSSKRDKQFWLVFESVYGDLNDFNLVVYDISNDTIILLSKTHYYRTTGVGVLPRIKQNSSMPNFYIRIRPNINSGQSNIELCDGNQLPLISNYAQFSTLSMQEIEEVQDIDNDNINDLVVSGNWIDSLRDDINSFKIFSAGKLVSVHENSNPIKNSSNKDSIFDFEENKFLTFTWNQEFQLPPLIELYNLLGQQLLHRDITNTDPVTIDISWLDNGVYLCKVGAYSKVFCISR